MNDLVVMGGISFITTSMFYEALLGWGGMNLVLLIFNLGLMAILLYGILEFSGQRVTRFIRWLHFKKYMIKYG